MSDVLRERELPWKSRVGTPISLNSPLSGMSGEMTGPQPRASRPVSSFDPRWPRSLTSALWSTTRPQSAHTISPRISSRMRWEEPQLGQTSAAGLAGTASAGVETEEREEARVLFDRDRELTEDAVVDFIASTLG